MTGGASANDTQEAPSAMVKSHTVNLVVTNLTLPAPDGDSRPLPGGNRMPTLQPVVHLTFTVTDPTRSAVFYNHVFGTETIVAASDDIGDITIVGNSANTIGLRRHTGTDLSSSFDPARVGLDHVGFFVGSREELEEWRDRLEANGVTHSDIVETSWGLHLSLKDPDNIALELFVPAQS
jgi:glyoxylase I family protein